MFVLYKKLFVFFIPNPENRNIMIGSYNIRYMQKVKRKTEWKH